MEQDRHRIANAPVSLDEALGYLKLGLMDLAALHASEAGDGMTDDDHFYKGDVILVCLSLSLVRQITIPVLLTTVLVRRAESLVCNK